MLDSDLRPQPKPAMGRLAGLCLVLTIAFLLFPAHASAHSTDAAGALQRVLPRWGAIHRIPTTGITLEVSAGFNARFRDGNWVPFHISLHNSGADFSGTLSINAPSAYAGGGNASSSTYNIAMSLANGAQKQVTMIIPINLGASGSSQTIRVNLLDSNGQSVSTQTSTITSLGQNDVFAGILSDQNTGFSPLFSVPLPNQGGTMIVESLNAATMPSAAVVLKNFDLIVLDNFTTSNLSGDQLTALQTWVNQGGALIEVGGPEWRRTLSTLPASLLPVAISGSSTLAAGSRLLPVGSETKESGDQTSVPATINAPVAVSTAQLASANGASTSTILASSTPNGIPLIVQEHQGQGIICYLAFDPTLEPVVNWAGANTLWKGLVQRTLGDTLLNSTNGAVPIRTLQTAGLGGILQTLLSNSYPSPWLLLILVLSYLVILGPVRLLIIRWSKRRDWSWRIVLSSIVVFSLLTYGLAIQQKGAAILSNSVSIIQFNQGTTSAHITTYVGVFVLNPGDYQLHIPGNGLVQPSIDQIFVGSNGNAQAPTTLSPGQDSTDVHLQGVPFSTTRALISERDGATQGGIVSQLTLRSGIVSGTITNTLGYGLSDVYVLVGNGFARVGHLSAGQTAQVNLPLSSAANASGSPLADQLAASSGLAVPYDGSTPGNELQRHMAILTALSGEAGYGYPVCGGNGPCKVVNYSGGSVSSTTVFLSGGGPTFVAANGSDPLLVAGSPATLIGWADAPIDAASNITVNGSSAGGLRETLVQSPLNLDFSGTLRLPTNFLSGQLIDVQGSTIQTQNAGVYTMSTGSMTFEFNVHIGSQLQVSGFTISEPANLQAGGPPVTSAGAPVDASHLQAFLYNWQTGSWDSISLNNLTFSTPNTRAYINPDGRILLRLANQDSSVGTIFFGKPTLKLQGSGS